MIAWWKAWSDWYQHELDMLSHYGYVYHLDEESIDSGVLIIDVEFQSSSEILHLEVIFPPEYPFFPPQVSAKDKSLARHRGGLENIFCLFGHASQSS